LFELHYIDVVSTACACTAHLDSVLPKLDLQKGTAFAKDELSHLKGVIFFQKLPHYTNLREKYVRALLAYLQFKHGHSYYQAQLDLFGQLNSCTKSMMLNMVLPTAHDCFIVKSSGGALSA
jgi:hypothetical protein